MTQRPCLFPLINYCAIVFSFALMFANGWLTACDGFYDASACWLSYMKQWTIDHWPYGSDNKQKHYNKPSHKVNQPQAYT